jgi:hypothetical protein
MILKCDEEPMPVMRLAEYAVFSIGSVLPEK